MKKTILMLFVTTFCSISMASHSITADHLAGNTYCRTVNMGGLFGQPEGDRSHCVSFDQTSLTDNANTFFGNPAETKPYMLVNGQIMTVNLLEDGSMAEVVYFIEDNETITNEAGAILKLID